MAGWAESGAGLQWRGDYFAWCDGKRNFGKNERKSGVEWLTDRVEHAGAQGTQRRSAKAGTEEEVMGRSVVELGAYPCR
jgi:hypothetical protein